VDLDPIALERAKLLARRENRTLGSVISEALTTYVTKEPPLKEDPPFELIVCGRPGARFPFAVDIAQAEEEEDLESLRIPRPRHADS
jgi:hypothetical protein